MVQLLQPELSGERANCELTAEDQQWLTGFGVDPSWQDDPFVKAELNYLTAIGSQRVHGSSYRASRHDEIVQARARFFNYLGLETPESPTNTPVDTFIGAQRMMSSRGLDSAKIVKAYRPAVAYSQESICEKIDNYISLDLDPVKIFDAHAAAIGPSSESVREKVMLLRRTSRVLKWENDVNDLIESYPRLLAFSTKRLQILRRIAAEHLSENARDIKISRLRSGLTVPLEKYILAISNMDEQNPDEDNLLGRARDLDLEPVERKERAIALAETGTLGRIGTMYLGYTKQAA